MRKTRLHVSTSTHQARSDGRSVTGCQARQLVQVQPDAQQKVVNDLPGAAVRISGSGYLLDGGDLIKASQLCMLLQEAACSLHTGLDAPDGQALATLGAGACCWALEGTLALQ